MVRAHERMAHVNRATAAIADRLGEYRQEHTVDDVQMLTVLNVLQADVLAALAGRRPDVRAADLHGLDIEVMKVQHDMGLTTVELLRALMTYGLDLSRFLLRLERHPNNPEKPADEA